MSDPAATPDIGLDGRVDIAIGTGNRAARLAWSLVETLLYRPSPRTAHGWRRMLLRCFGARVAGRAHPYPRTRIWAPWNLVLEDGATLDNDVVCLNNTEIWLGRDATISQASILCTSSRDIDRPGRPVTGAPIRIEAGAWVAVGCYIGPGVSIGAHAVVGACSVVTRDVAAYSVVAGAPPRLLRMRDPATCR